MNPIKFHPSAHASAHIQWWPPTALTASVMDEEAAGQSDGCHGPANDLVVKVQSSIPPRLHNDDEKLALSKHRDIKSWDGEAYAQAMQVKVKVWLGQSQ